MAIERTSFEGVSFTPLAQLQGNPVIGGQYAQAQPMQQAQPSASPASFLPKPEGMA
jgi:hypothetical protein